MFAERALWLRRSEQTLELIDLSIQRVSYELSSSHIIK